MNTKLIWQNGIVFFSLVCLGFTPLLQSQLICAEVSLQKKPVTEAAKPPKENTPRQKPTQRKGINLKQQAPNQKLPVEPIIEEMRRAGKLIENKQTGRETQQIQQQVVQNLEALIRQIETAPQNPSPRPSPNNNQKPDDKKNSGKQKGGQGEQSSQQVSQGPARKSSERNEQGLVTTGDLANRNAYIKDAWGHLPPAMRQKLLNIYTEKFLPQYEDQVRRYYEALAEKKKRTP